MKIKCNQLNEQKTQIQHVVGSTRVLIFCCKTDTQTGAHVEVGKLFVPDSWADKF